MLRSTVGRAVVLGLLAMAAACAPAPRVRPVKGGDVDAGPESLTAARKFLEGRWTLESFEVFPPGKPAIALKGAGTLNYDEFGNLRIEIRADEKSADLLRAAGIEIRDGDHLVRWTDGRRSAEPDAQLCAPGAESRCAGAGSLSPADCVTGR